MKEWILKLIQEWQFRREVARMIRSAFVKLNRDKVFAQKAGAMYFAEQSKPGRYTGTDRLRRKMLHVNEYMCIHGSRETLEDIGWSIGVPRRTWLLESDDSYRKRLRARVVQRRARVC